MQIPATWDMTPRIVQSLGKLQPEWTPRIWQHYNISYCYSTTELIPATWEKTPRIKKNLWEIASCNLGKDTPDQKNLWEIAAPYCISI